jgi:hypothetical protein
MKHALLAAIALLALSGCGATEAQREYTGRGCNDERTIHKPF